MPSPQSYPVRGRRSLNGRPCDRLHVATTGPTTGDEARADGSRRARSYSPAMPRSPHVTVTVDLDRIRANAEALAAHIGVPLIAVVKADAYGLGAEPVADAIEAVVERFAVFGPADALALGRPALALGPVVAEAARYRALQLRPCVGSAAEAEAMRGLRVAINVDTGMQRFGCPPAELDALLARCDAAEVLSHAVTVEAAERLQAVAGHLGLPLHAAGSALLHEPRAWLDAVRPGDALYAGALEVTAPLVTVRTTHGPVGYTGFEHRQVGVILVGYAQGLRAGAPVWIGETRQQLLEVGMNAAFVGVPPGARVGDAVELVGRHVEALEVATALALTPQQVCCLYAGLGERRYRGRRLC